MGIYINPSFLRHPPLLLYILFVVKNPSLMMMLLLLRIENLRKTAAASAFSSVLVGFCLRTPDVRSESITPSILPCASFVSLVSVTLLFFAHRPNHQSNLTFFLPSSVLSTLPCRDVFWSGVYRGTWPDLGARGVEHPMLKLDQTKRNKGPYTLKAKGLYMQGDLARMARHHGTPIVPLKDPRAMLETLAAQR